MTDWNDSSLKILLEFLAKREYLYNRNHKNYKTYTIVKECAEIGKSLKPPRSSKEVLNKITALRIDITLFKQIVDNGYNKYTINDLEKYKRNIINCNFMYATLFGESLEPMLSKLDQFLYKNSKRKLVDEDVICRKIPKNESLTEHNLEQVDFLSQDQNKYNAEDIQIRYHIKTKNTEDQNKYNAEDIQISLINEKEHDTENINRIQSKTKTNLMLVNNESINYNLQHEDSNSIKSTSDSITLEEESFMKPYKIFYLECTDEIASEDEIITLKIINFIRNKPYYYKDTNLDKTDIYMEQDLKHFGKTFNPPLTPQKIKNIIKYIINKFNGSLTNPEGKRWCWFDQCKFLINDAVKPDSNDIKLTYPTIQNLERTRTEDPKLLLEIISFIEDNPFFYNENDCDFLNYDKRIEFKNRFTAALQYTYDKEDISKMLDYSLKRISRTLKKNFNDFSYCNTIYNATESNEISQKNKIENVVSESNFKTKEVDVKQTVKSNTVSVQCNLYEELWEEQIKKYNLNNRDCTCVKDFFQTVYPQNEKTPEDTKFEDLLNTHYSDKIFEEEKDNFDFNEENVIGNYIIRSDSPDFSDYSSDDGLTEIPFPDIVHKIPTRLPNGKVQCEDCDKLFDDLVQLNAHEKTHGEKSLVCYKCGKINKYYRILRLHENNCNPSGNKNCYECKLTFKSHLNYYDHQNQFHTKSNPYICVCRQAFTSYNKIITHLNRSDCGVIDDCILPDYVTKHFIKGFLEHIYDDEDEFVKTMEKTKFWCKICKRNFVRNDVYTKHFTRQFHLNAEAKWLKENDMDKIFACDYCNNDDEPTIFKSLHQLVVHRHSAHHKCTLSEFFEDMEYIAKNTQDLSNDLPEDISLTSLICRICKNKYELKFYNDHFRSKIHKESERSWIINHDLRFFECKTCSLNFDNLIQFLEHRYEVHSEWPTNKLIKQIEGIDTKKIGKNYYKYYCSICDYKTKNRRYYSNHVVNHGSYYRCLCNKSFGSYKKFFAHKCNKN